MERSTRPLPFRGRGPAKGSSAMIHFSCPVCRAQIKAPPKAAGRKLPCPSCKQRLQVPAPAVQIKTVLGKLEPDPQEPSLVDAAAPDGRPLELEEWEEPASRGGDGFWTPAKVLVFCGAGCGLVLAIIVIAIVATSGSTTSVPSRPVASTPPVAAVDPELAEYKAGLKRFY